MILRLLLTIAWIEKEEKNVSHVTQSHVSDKSPNLASVADPFVKGLFIKSQDGEESDVDKFKTDDFPRRLKKLAEDGCDPNEVKEWLELKIDTNIELVNSILTQANITDFHEAHSLGFIDGVRPVDTYRAIRFIEVSGLPINVPRILSFNVCTKLHRNATRMVSFLSVKEGIGHVLRSRDSKTIELFLSSETLSALSADQVTKIRDLALEAFRRAKPHLGPPPSPREIDDDWWEEQLGLSAKILASIVTRLSDDAIGEIAREAISLAGDEHVWSRFRIDRDLNDLVSRTLAAVGPDSRESMFASALAKSIPKSDIARAQRLRDIWPDPVTAMSPNFFGRMVKNEKIDKAKKQLLTDIRTSRGRYRETLVIRAAHLLHDGQWTQSQKVELADAIYARSEMNGFPADTGCLDALILALPRQAGIDERSLFRQKYLDSDPSENPKIWNELKRTVNRFGPPRSKSSRSINWTQSDLDKILELSESWVPQLCDKHGKIRGEKSLPGLWNQLRRHKRDGLIAEYHDWLRVMEDVVLLARNATEKHVERVENMLSSVRESGLETAIIQPTLRCVKSAQSEDVAAEIAEKLNSRDEWTVWQSRAAIARWCELTRAEYKPQIPHSLLSTLGGLVVARRHDRLALLLNTTRDVINILGKNVPREFIDQALCTLSSLLPETAYDSNPSFFKTEKKIRLRTICVKLADDLRKADVEHVTIQQWLNVAEIDLFTDVRRAI
ncbi:MAG: hypothetical protein WEB58_02925 [Planctomycetaceae bacterium]